MKFRTYNDGGDAQLFVSTENEKQTVKENDFVFTGFGNGIHPYHRKRINWIVEMLKSKGIILNIAEVSTVDKMGSDVDNGELAFENMFIPKGFDKKSEDGNTYILFQDTEMGRGWACLIKNDEILTQEHRDTVLDEIEEGDFIRSFGIDYKVETVKDLDKFRVKLSKQQSGSTCT
jgi:hypothetical protein